MTVSYQPQVWDVRQPEDGSLSVLPRLGKDEWPRLKSFMQTHWPEFDILGTHGEQRAKSGERWWHIGAIEVKEGPALFQVQFRIDENTYDSGNILSFFSWPGAPALDSSIDVLYSSQGVYSFSEGADSKGYPYGSASGPYSIWLNSDPPNWTDRRVGSDCLSNVHWFDNHVSLNPVFWPMRKGGTVPPPSTGEDYLVNIDASGTITGHIKFVAGPPPSGKNLLGLSRSGVIIAYVEWDPTAPVVPAAQSYRSVLQRIFG